MSETKEPEQIMRELFELLKQLEMVKIKTEWPVPVVRDRQGKLTKDYTLKDWMLKCHEEDLEFFDMAKHICGLDKSPAVEISKNGCYGDDRWFLIEEFCDMIHVRFSMIHQFGITPEEIAAGICRSDKKAKERGLID
jgi:hypothetical protein